MRDTCDRTRHRRCDGLKLPRRNTATDAKLQNREPAPLVAFVGARYGHHFVWNRAFCNAPRAPQRTMEFRHTGTHRLHRGSRRCSPKKSQAVALVINRPGSPSLGSFAVKQFRVCCSFASQLFRPSTARYSSIADVVTGCSAPSDPLRSSSLELDQTKNAADARTKCTSTAPKTQKRDLKRERASCTEPDAADQRRRPSAASDRRCTPDSCPRTRPSLNPLRTRGCALRCGRGTSDHG